MLADFELTDLLQPEALDDVGRKEVSSEVLDLLEIERPVELAHNQPAVLALLLLADDPAFDR